MMADDNSEWIIQVNVKVGDHLVNIRGKGSRFVLDKLDELAGEAERLHAALEKLDGRPATEIVTKEKTWGARSQAGRTYPKTATASSPTGSATSSPPKPVEIVADPHQLLTKELGAVRVGTETNAAASPGVPHDVANCGIHGKPRQHYGPGVSSKTNKEYSASYRCPERGCAAVWANRDGSW